MSDAPERIWATEDRENYGEDRFHTTRPMRGLTEYIRADLSDALLREAVAVLAKAQDQSCEGFCEQLPQADTYTPDMDLYCATCFLRPTLAKLREHMGETK